MRRFALVLIAGLLAACTAAPQVAPTEIGRSNIPTAEPTTSTATQRPTVTVNTPPTVTLTPTVTLAPSPTPISAVITPQNVEQLQTVLRLEHSRGEISGVALSPDGVRVASGGRDERVYIAETITGETLFTLERHSDDIHTVEFAPDGSALVSGGEDRTMQIWDPITGVRLGGSRTSGEVVDIAFAPDSLRFATVGFYSAIGEVWQSPTGAPLDLLEGHTTRLRSTAYDPSGRWLATGDEGGRIIVRDAQTGESEFDFVLEGSQALTLAFSPDGTHLAAGTSRTEIRVYNLITRRVAVVWPAHSNQVSRVLYTPDGQLLISAGLDGTIRFWDTTSYERAAQLTGHGASVRDIALSGDGTTLASGGDDWRIFIWRVTP